MRPRKAEGNGRAPWRSVRVDRRESGTRLDLFLVTAFPGLSRKKAKRLVDGRRVLVNGRIESMASRVLRGGEEVAANLSSEPRSLPHIEITVLYEDEHCVSVAKPPGLPSGPTRDPSRVHAQQLAQAHIGRQLTLLHRLDKDTSGVLLLAKTPDFASSLTRAFKRREVDKVYLALVHGTASAGFRVVSHLREGEGGRMLAVRSGGMRAETRFRLLASAAGFSLIEARPRTGRTHQIRVQLADSGHAVLGDALYGGAASVGGLPVPRQMLHASLLGFQHPVLEREKRIQAPVPEDFVEVSRTIFGARLPDAVR